jgi:predicted transcriptional regulator of viral defense system
MNTDEREIFNYLQTWGGEFISVKEVCRRASTKKRYHDDPNWAQPLLQMMAERGLLERNLTGHYRIKPEPKKKHDGRWVSPEIKEILDENGVQVETHSTETDLDRDEPL